MTTSVRESARVLVGVFEIRCLDGMFVAIDRQRAKPAEVSPGVEAIFPDDESARAWCAANSAKARKR